jgi:ribulose bisphosphate carboxylase small subunit
MSVVLIINNDSENTGEKTKLNATQSVVGTALEFENNQGFSANDFVCVGRAGAEQSELKKLSSINADQKNVVLASATKFIHKKFEEITKFFYDQRKIYRKLSGASTYTLIATVDIQVDRPEGTIYEDNTGVNTAQYKATYYNSQTTTETSIDDAVAMYGGGGTHYCELSEIREEAGFQNNDNITEERIYRTRARAEGEINASLVSRYSLPITSNTYWSDSTGQELLRQIAMVLSAGWIMWQEYPDERGNGTSKDGIAKIKEARSMLKDIREGKLVLLGSDNNPMTRVDTMSIEGYPNNSFSTIPDENHDDDENYIFQLGKSW